MSQVPSAQNPSQPPQAPLPLVSSGKKRRDRTEKKANKPKKAKVCPQPPPFNRDSDVSLRMLAERHPDGLLQFFKHRDLTRLGLRPRCSPVEAGRQLVERAKNDPALGAELEFLFQDMEKIHNLTIALMLPRIQAKFRQRQQSEAEFKERLESTASFLRSFGHMVPGIRRNIQRIYHTRNLALQLVSVQAQRQRRVLNVRLTCMEQTSLGPHNHQADVTVKLGNGSHIRLLHHFSFNDVNLGPTMDRVGLAMVENKIKRGQTEGHRSKIYSLPQVLVNYIAGFLFEYRILKNGHGLHA
jgi:hypothetical protein